MGQRCIYFNYDSNIVIIHLIVLVIFMSMITGHQTKLTLPEIDYVTANHHIINLEIRITSLSSFYCGIFILIM